MFKNGELASAAQSDPATPVVRRIVDLLHGIQYGTVEITVHDGKVVQIERREKYRLPPSGGVRG